MVGLPGRPRLRDSAEGVGEGFVIGEPAPLEEAAAER
jgi:hypothetical protein